MDVDKGQQTGSGSGEEKAIRRALAYLCRSVPGFREQSAHDRIAFLQGLGLSAAVAQDVAERFERLFDGAQAPFPEVLLPVRCPLNWRPSVRTPVFHGYQDVDPAGAVFPFSPESLIGSTRPEEIPTKMRVFYPSLSGTKKDAPLLYDCGPYPLVVFLHGQCPGAASNEHYRHWYHLPQQLARCGYVVVVPQLGDTLPFGEGHLELAERVAAWMRQQWRHRGQIAPPPATGIVGHSYGAILGGRLANRIGASAFVSLSGEWKETDGNRLPPPHPLEAISVPVLFTWGTGEDFDANLDNRGEMFFNMVKGSKHKISFEGGNHFDYLSADLQARCGQDVPGPCDLLGLLAADFTALFLTRYMPPRPLNYIVSPSLRYTSPTELTPEQEFYAGSHLVGLSLIGGSPDCALTHSWVIEGGQTGTLTLPRNQD